jgi:Cu-processing system permease protein
MNAILKIFKYEAHDMIRTKWMIIYASFFLIITYVLFRFGGDTSRVIVSMMNIVLIVIPLVNIIFGSLYLYHSREFIELLLSQPVNRRHLYFGIYSGISLPLAAAFLTGAGIPFLFYGFKSPGEINSLVIMLLSGVLLTLIFSAIAFLIAIYNDDKVKGFGKAILIWFLFAVLYDGFMLFVVYSLGDYPIEKALIFLSFLNPIDLARITLLLDFDLAVMMGYTGAVFQKFFGSSTGTIISIFVMFMWILIPFAMGIRKFVKKDF